MLENSDRIVVNYHGKTYNYIVIEKKIVEATDLSVLKKGSAEVLTIMTCWPIGTNLKRLIIKAKPSI